MAAKEMKQIFNPDTHHGTIQKRQLYNIRKLNQKIVTENAILVQADKRKTMVIKFRRILQKGQTFLTDKTSIYSKEIPSSNTKS